MQQAAVTILQCDFGISHHHTAAAAAMTRSIEPVLLLLLWLWLCQFLIDPIHCRVRGHTDRQTYAFC